VERLRPAPRRARLGDSEARDERRFGCRESVDRHAVHPERLRNFARGIGYQLLISIVLNWTYGNFWAENPSGVDGV